jgi:hypothetical protein
MINLVADLRLPWESRPKFRHRSQNTYADFAVAAVHVVDGASYSINALPFGEL